MDERPRAARWAETMTDRRSLLRVAAGLGLGALLAPALAACGGSPSGPAAVPVASPGPDGVVRGGTLRVSLAEGDAATFDPIAATDDVSLRLLPLVYDQLVRVGAGGKSLEPGLAERWDSSPDGTLWTFSLRAAVFHDGAPVRADDCVYSLERAARDPASRWAWLFDMVTDIAALDQRTLTIRLRRAWGPLLAALAAPAASIVPKARHQREGAALFASPVGSGPFALAAWDQGRRIALRRHDRFWEPGKPYLDGLELLVLPDPDERVAAFTGGALDVVTDVPVDRLRALESRLEARAVTQAPARFDGIFINNLKPPFDDRRVRQALNFAVDRQAIVEQALGGFATPANTMLPRVLYHDAKLAGYAHDPNMARVLLAQAGNPRLSATLLVDPADPTGAAVARLLARQLGEVGVDLTVQPGPPGVARAETKLLEFDLAKRYYASHLIDPTEVVRFNLSNNGDLRASWTGYRDGTLDKLAQAAEYETDPTRRKHLYSQIQEISNLDAPVILLYYPGGRSLARGEVRDFTVLPTGAYRLWETWLAPATPTPSA